jgi:2-isopropylmalate synthase
MADQVLLYDTTLRDGMQGEGMSLSVGEKVRVAHALDSLGIHLIEAGFPSSNPKEAALFDVLAGESFAHAEVVAFGMTRRRDGAAVDDSGLRVLADCFAPVCTLVGKTWSLHLEKVTRVDPEENLAMIEDSVAFLAAQGKRVIYDAEHFFDAYRDDPGYAIRCLHAAADAGAENLTLCDTNGSTLPGAVAEATGRVVGELGQRASVGIHTHDDAGCGVANSLMAIDRGARLVQGTMNGYGERCGNANLVTVLADLQLKLGYDCVPGELLGRLTETAHLVDELCNVSPNPNQPYVGANAFAHKGGMHIAGVNRDARTFEHIDPADVGADRRLLVSELSGKGTVQARAALTGLDLDDVGARRVVERVKDLEHRGYHLEAADGSFDLLIRRETGDYLPLFRLESWRVIVEKREHRRGGAQPERSRGGAQPERRSGEHRTGGSSGEHRTGFSPVETEATIKIWVDGERYVRTAEGNGPVNALDCALRAAIGETYPHLRDIELVNFKVRILDETKGTGAVTRVLLDASDGHTTWGAIGVSENVIEASWDALVDSLEAGMLPGRAERAHGDSAAGTPGR